MFIKSFRCAWVNVCLTLGFHSEPTRKCHWIIRLVWRLRPHIIVITVEWRVNMGNRCKFYWANGWNQSIMCVYKKTLVFVCPNTGESGPLSISPLVSQSPRPFSDHWPTIHLSPQSQQLSSIYFTGYALITRICQKCWAVITIIAALFQLYFFWNLPKWRVLLSIIFVPSGKCLAPISSPDSTTSLSDG